MLDEAHLDDVLPSFPWSREPCLPYLQEQLTSAPLSVRKGAIEALGQSRDNNVVSSLIPLLQDHSPEIRLETVRALGRIGKAEAVDKLLTLLRDEVPEVRQMAVWALDEIQI